MPIKKNSQDASDHRVYARDAELGVGWKEESNSGETNYHALKVDDPSFASLIWAAFFENAKDGTGVMVGVGLNMFDKHTNYSDENIEYAIALVAGVINLYGDAYWPIFDRLEQEFETRNSKRKRLKKYLKNNQK